MAGGGGDVAQGRREGDVGRRAQEAVHALAIGIELEAHHVAGVALEQVAREVAVGVVVLAGVEHPLHAGEAAQVGGQRLGIALRALEARSEEHTSELQSLMRISYAVFRLKKKKQRSYRNPHA